MPNLQKQTDYRQHLDGQKEEHGEEEKVPNITVTVYTGRSPGQAVGMAGCGHSKIARVCAYYLYCMCLAVLTSV